MEIMKKKDLQIQTKWIKGSNDGHFSNFNEYVGGTNDLFFNWLRAFRVIARHP